MPDAGVGEAAAAFEKARSAYGTFSQIRSTAATLGKMKDREVPSAKEIADLTRAAKAASDAYEKLPDDLSGVAAKKAAKAATLAPSWARGSPVQQSAKRKDSDCSFDSRHSPGSEASHHLSAAFALASRFVDSGSRPGSPRSQGSPRGSGVLAHGLSTVAALAQSGKAHYAAASEPTRDAGGAGEAATGAVPMVQAAIAQGFVKASALAQSGRGQVSQMAAARGGVKDDSKQESNAKASGGLQTSLAQGVAKASALAQAGRGQVSQMAAARGDVSKPPKDVNDNANTASGLPMVQAALAKGFVKASALTHSGREQVSQIAAARAGRAPTEGMKDGTASPVASDTEQPSANPRRRQGLRRTSDPALTEEAEVVAVRTWDLQSLNVSEPSAAGELRAAGPRDDETRSPMVQGALFGVANLKDGSVLAHSGHLYPVPCNSEDAVMSDESLVRRSGHSSEAEPGGYEAQLHAGETWASYPLDTPGESDLMRLSSNRPLADACDVMEVQRRSFRPQPAGDGVGEDARREMHGTASLPAEADGGAETSGGGAPAARAQEFLSKASAVAPTGQNHAAHNVETRGGPGQTGAGSPATSASATPAPLLVQASALAKGVVRARVAQMTEARKGAEQDSKQESNAKASGGLPTSLAQGVAKASALAQAGRAQVSQMAAARDGVKDDSKQESNASTSGGLQAGLAQGIAKASALAMAGRAQVSQMAAARDGVKDDSKQESALTEGVAKASALAQAGRAQVSQMAAARDGVKDDSKQESNASTSGGLQAGLAQGVAKASALAQAGRAQVSQMAAARDGVKDDSKQESALTEGVAKASAQVAHVVETEVDPDSTDSLPAVPATLSQGYAKALALREQVWQGREDEASPDTLSAVSESRASPGYTFGGRLRKFVAGGAAASFGSGSGARSSGAAAVRQMRQASTTVDTLSDLSESCAIHQTPPPTPHSPLSPQAMVAQPGTADVDSGAVLDCMRAWDNAQLDQIEGMTERIRRMRQGLQARNAVADHLVAQQQQQQRRPYTSPLRRYPSPAQRDHDASLYFMYR